MRLTQLPHTSWRRPGRAGCSTIRQAIGCRIPQRLHGFQAGLLMGTLLALGSCSPGSSSEQVPSTPIRFAETGSIPAYTVRGRWLDARHLTYHVDDSRGGVHREQDLAGSVRRALDRWSALGNVTFLWSDDPLGADVVFSFEASEHTGCAAFGKDTSVAHTGMPVSGTYVHFDAGRDWGGAASLDFAALHEVGHVFGLDHTEYPRSLMYVAATEPEAQLGEGERAGFVSLYGGSMEPDPSDLWVRDAEGVERVLLWRAAPPGLSDFAVFDADGDGRDEVLIWRTDPAGAGVLTAYFFDREGRLARTVGPLWGAVVPGSQVQLSHLPSGHRVLSCQVEGSAPVRRGFDEHCRLERALPTESSPGERFATQAGDLGGSGENQSVFRR